MSGFHTILRSVTLPLAVASVLVCVPQQAAAQENLYENTEIFLLATVDPANNYVGAPLCYSVKLYSTNPSIEYARPLSSPRFEGFEAINYPRVRSRRDGNIQREMFDGKSYYTVVLDDMMLVPSEAGKWSITGGEYIIGVNEYSLYSDPFWGTVRRLHPAEYPAKAPDMTVRVKKLPSGAPKGFSGAIGNYHIQSILPDGPISPEEEATVIFRIRGTGDLKSAVMPDVAVAFPEDVELKSVSQDLQTWQQENAVMSEMTLECTFVPLAEGDIKIAPVDFTFLNPETGKYVKTASDAVYFTATRPSLPSAPPVYHEI